MSITQLAGLTGWVALSRGAPVKRADTFNLKPFVINLSGGVPRMLDLVKQTRLPSQPEYSGLGPSAGIALDVLERLQTQWTDGFDWGREEAIMNK